MRLRLRHRFDVVRARPDGSRARLHRDDAATTTPPLIATRNKPSTPATLTPTLSRKRERETGSGSLSRRRHRIWCSLSCRRDRIWFPLPLGEGQGEGPRLAARGGARPFAQVVHDLLGHREPAQLLVPPFTRLNAAPRVDLPGALRALEDPPGLLELLLESALGKSHVARRVFHLARAVAQVAEAH